MEELSTPVEAVVEDTSVATEPVETTDTSTETVTEPETTTNEPTAETTDEGEQAPAQEEKLYAGKYKSIEDLEKGYKEAEKSFNKVAELEKQLKAFQDNQPKYVDEKGKVNPELKAKYDFQIDSSEFATYADLATTLDEATRNEVQNLLNQAQRAYQYDKRTYQQKLSEAQNYFSSDIVKEIERRKIALQQQAQAEMQSYEAKAKKDRQDACLKQIQEVPELMDLVNPQSENYSQEFDNMLFATFNSYGSIDIPSTTKIVNYIKELGVKEFQAKQKLETEKQNAVINTGTKVSTTTATMPSADELRANPSLYDKAVKKYGMDKVDAVIMKG